MKKYLSILFFALCIGTAASAVPGDTTWVYGNNVNLTYYGSFDSVIAFPHPGTSYRKILMIFTLGKYSCPGYTYGTGPVPWCGDWDYTVQNYLMTPGGDTLEIGRLITPYANNTAPRTPWTWQQHYVYDVTDYAGQLHDNATMRIFFSGYSGGFTANIKFAFIEGIPDRDVLKVTRLWHGSFNYGDTSHSDSNNINTHFLATTQIAPAGTSTAELKFTVTGHGSDSNYCNEFCSHNYQYQVNGATAGTKTIWRSDCGANELYPQSGTWLYERANWCPGALVNADHNVLPGVGAGSTFNTSIVFDNYVRRGGGPIYTTEATLFYYGPLNKTLDASLDAIIAPNNDENHFRENPLCGTPMIHVKNTGATTITSMDIQYGLTDSTYSTYTWTGSLASLTDTDILLPPLPQLTSITGTSGLYNFTASIVSVNGTADADSTNNTLTSYFVSAPSWPGSFKITMLTNNEAVTTGSSICETSWIMYDMYDNVVAQRTNANLSTVYVDTVTLGAQCYKLVVTDLSCDGLNWWANSGSGISSGYLNVRKLNGTYIPMNGYQYSGQFNNDFGCGFTQYFYAAGWPMGVNNLAEATTGIEAYPNPATNSVNIDITGLPKVDGTITVIDMLGRNVMTGKCTGTHYVLNSGQLTNGVYTIQYNDRTNSSNKLTARIVIAK